MIFDKTENQEVKLRDAEVFFQSFLFLATNDNIFPKIKSLIIRYMSLFEFER
jgi:hypothetical protein